MPKNVYLSMIGILKTKLERFIEVNHELWEEVQRNTTELFIKKGGILIKYGSIDRNVYVVASGSFEAILLSTNGNRQVVWFFFDDFSDAAVCMDSHFLGELTKYEIKAMEDSLVYAFKKSDIDAWLIKYPNFNLFFRSHILEQLIDQNEIRNHMVSHTPHDFLQYLKEKYPVILKRTPRKKLAQFMGITPEWLSKITKKSIL
ncbi:MAG: Crp/Fnr family transcriptional regulator [Bacteroidota bacterium]